MNRTPQRCFILLCWLGVPERADAGVEHDAQNPQLVFATQEFNAALIESGQEELQVTLKIELDEASPEAFRIQRVGTNQITVIGADANGTMYGGIEVAEYLKLGLPIKNVARKPFLEKRGIKFNIPLDARSPSYDDSVMRHRKTSRTCGILKASGNRISMAWNATGTTR